MNIANISNLSKVLFADTIAARMLRAVVVAGEMTQADFMREYMRRCARNGTGPSGFLCNFGRYVQSNSNPRSHLSLGNYGGGDYQGKGRKAVMLFQTPIPLRSARTAYRVLARPVAVRIATSRHRDACSRRCIPPR